VSTHFQTIPIAIPIPDRLILFSPHPDDIAISMSALAAWAAPRVPVAIVLMTDGSEAQLPQHVLQARIHHAATTREKQQARGMMRVEEAMREAAFLGFDRSIVQLLDRQNRFLQHRTPAEYLNPDGTCVM
jgi:LmbE family N-acetylglucosaminyl deacetylase